MFSDFEDGGEMWTGTGPRQHRRAIAFSQAYRSAPSVHVSMTMFDMDQKTNMRADITAESVSDTGFDLVFRTWADTRVARVRVDWLSIGEIAHEDDWDLY